MNEEKYISRFFPGLSGYAIFLFEWVGCFFFLSLEDYIT